MKRDWLMRIGVAMMVLMTLGPMAYLHWRAVHRGPCEDLEDDWMRKNAPNNPLPAFVYCAWPPTADAYAFCLARDMCRADVERQIRSMSR